MIWLTVLGMTAATYLPRLLPFLIGSRVKPPEAIRRWLESFPFAVLGALVIPGILTAAPGSRWLGAAAGLVAAGLALLTPNVTLVVVATIAITFVLQRLL